MTHELYQKLQGWLQHGTDAQRTQAVNRLKYAEDHGEVIAPPEPGSSQPITSSEVIPGLGSLANLPGPARIKPGCRPCH
jgi:hypothetical protein